ncbi:hypothetical protein BGW38_008728 [Lunasporangiospora selenospora]|uniref:Uncharacterized protein n=1 Tax=Lunasporangiospora selenospora TaxID=979761 RepID=A0A9P6G4Q1_9FUNG|nr:hypothetical protein BGW38_008728 [Lunasporangiospora selenospora]
MDGMMKVDEFIRRLKSLTPLARQTYTEQQLQLSESDSDIENEQKGQERSDIEQGGYYNQDVYSKHSEDEGEPPRVQSTRKYALYEADEDESESSHDEQDQRNGKQRTYSSRYRGALDSTLQHDQDAPQTLGCATPVVERKNPSFHEKATCSGQASHEKPKPSMADDPDALQHAFSGEPEVQFQCDSTSLGRMDDIRDREEHEERVIWEMGEDEDEEATEGRIQDNYISVKHVEEVNMASLTPAPSPTSRYDQSKCHDSQQRIEDLDVESSQWLTTQPPLLDEGTKSMNRNEQEAIAQSAKRTYEEQEEIEEDISCLEIDDLDMM